MLINRMKVLQACTNKGVAANVHIAIANSLPALLTHLKRDEGYAIDRESVWAAMNSVGITNHHDAYCHGAVSVIQWMIENEELDIVLVEATEVDPDGGEDETSSEDETGDDPSDNVKAAAVENATKKRTGRKTGSKANTQ